MIRFDRSRMRAGFGRDFVLDLLESGFEAVDPKRCMREVLFRDGERLRVGSTVLDMSERRVWAIAIGKAAVPMAEAASERLGSALAGGIVVTRYGYGGPWKGFACSKRGIRFRMRTD
jgi:glycerate-2-kinase